MNRRSFVVVVLACALLVAACQPLPTGQAQAKDKLAEVLAKGTLVISTDPAYPPQSQLVENAQRVANTHCTSEQRTATELQGFDIEVAKEIAKRLNVEPCWMTPDWTLIIAGGWSDRWDISVGSMTITEERMKSLYFSKPYYTTPAVLYVNKDNTTYKGPADLAGKKIGVATGTTYDSYLGRSLVIPGVTISYTLDNPQIKGYETDLNALQDLALGDGLRLDAAFTAQPTGQGAIDGGLGIKQLGEPLFFEYLAAAIDQKAAKDPQSFVNKVSEIIQAMHDDGTLLRLSQQSYKADLTSAAAKFDVNALKQFK